MSDEGSEALHIRIAVLETKLISANEARKLQAEEYERRLTELNHIQATANQDRAKFVTADLFYAKVDDILRTRDTKFHELDVWRNQIDTWRAKVTGIALSIGAAAGIAGGIISSLITRLIDR
jgi:hypothetical protein